MGEWDWTYIHVLFSLLRLGLRNADLDTSSADFMQNREGETRVIPYMLLYFRHIVLDHLYVGIWIRDSRRCLWLNQTRLIMY